MWHAQRACRVDYWRGADHDCRQRQPYDDARSTRRTHMSQPEQYDVLVLGSGAGGKLLSWHMARSGRRTAVVERRWIGGSCPNIACLPSKNEIWSAKVAHLLHHAADFGLAAGPVGVDMAAVRARKRAMVDGLVEMH